MWTKDPIGCFQACGADSECVSAFWRDENGGICAYSVTAAAPVGKRSLTLIPILPDDEACNGKVAAAVRQAETNKNQQCARNITAAVNQAKTDKNLECARNITTASHPGQGEERSGLCSQYHCCSKPDQIR
jgi:hypothetical protein